MKLLLDENLPIELKKEFEDSEFNVFTVKDMKWEGIKNGELLEKMYKENFDVLLTMDKKLVKQQNISKYNLSITILEVINNKIQTLIPLILRVKKHLRGKPFEKFVLFR